MKSRSLLPRRAWLIVGLLWIVACLNYLDRVMITTMRVSIVHSIPMTEAQFGLLTSVFLLVYGLLSPFSGFLADRFSRSAVIIGSLVVWSLVTWLTAHAKTFDQLLLTRALMGVSEAFYIPASLALVADYHRGATRSLATGLLVGGVLVGSGLGGLGGWLADRHEWSYAFKLFGLVGLAYSIALALLLRDAPPAPTASDEPVRPLGKIEAAAALRSLFSSVSFSLAFVYWGLLAIAGWMVIGWMPTFFQERYHLTQGAAGLIATIYVNAASLFGLLLGGAWADRWSRTQPRACIFVAAIGLLASSPGLMVMAHTRLLWIAIAGAVLYGITRSFADTEMMPILCLICDSRYRATGFGLLNFFASMVGGATIYLGGAMRDARIDVSLLFQCGAVGLVLCAVLLMFVRPRPA